VRVRREVSSVAVGFVREAISVQKSSRGHYEKTSRMIEDFIYLGAIH
jgi:hypothetical protein